VVLRPSATQLQVEIVDNGIGIEAEHLQSGAIFKPFFQASHQRCESEKGVGLGLSIVHAMIELLPGHRLELNSVQGQGTRLAITLPWADSASARPAATAEAASLAAAWPAAPADALRGVYVLYVEDDDLVRSATCALFEAYGLLYEAASSLAHLRSLLQDIERRPDLVISDYRLPGGKTAADVAEMVHQSDPDVPMLILTGEGLQDEPRTPHWTTLRKPVAAPHLLATIRRLVQAQAVS
jgi:two-component system, sensor histidine kinase